MPSRARDMRPATATTVRVLVMLCAASFALGLLLGSAVQSSASHGPASSEPGSRREAPAPDREPPTTPPGPASGSDPAAAVSAMGSVAAEVPEGHGGVASRTRIASGNAAIEQVIRAAALEFGVDEEAFLRVAVCESKLDPLAIGSADELGILQFRPKTFRANARALGYTLADILDVRAQARVAAEMWSRGQKWQWTCAT